MEDAFKCDTMLALLARKHLCYNNYLMMKTFSACAPPRLKPHF